MITFTIYNPNVVPTQAEQEEIVDFLYKHLGKYGDDKSAIHNCLQFAIAGSAKHTDGFVLCLKDSEGIKGVTIVNKTGMEAYIPPNILVYIAVDKNERGKGYGKKLMEKAIAIADGDIALHVEADNPAKKLYEALGFENKYLEMRLKK